MTRKSIITFWIIIIGLAIIAGCFKQSTTPETNQADRIQLNLTNPAPWSNVYGQVEIKAESNPLDLIDHVEFFVDGTMLGTDTLPPYSFIWNADVIGQSYTIFVRAIAKDGSSTNSPMITVFVRPGSDIEPPSVWITYPAPWITVADTVDILVEVTDNFQVAAIVILQDGERLDSIAIAPWHFRWDTGAETPGNHTLMAKAYDNSGNIGYSDLVVVTVQP